MTETEGKKAVKSESKPSKKKKAASRPKWKRVVFSISRWLAIPLLCVVALCTGLVLGYVYLGKRPLEEVYELDTWRHIYDLVFSIA
ncbi:DNA-directed RNA polymerase subunit beta [Paenibacillus sp. NPDC056579]|uniref:DNA-directed RNA polymerase subunit beta n=1 Tax=unclassified Paenibacillus TaxID=185978 RepID=UPI001EF8B4B9|nr:DNA-directed RNA polymerase subunit beta [Paenibacillus sp. H1-7]ULL19477.1 DNA-directed RNA polymerase subunit beta [Paenibacillus sp. H1-7]